MDKCPRQTVTAETNDAIDWWSRLDGQSLTPVGGGWLEQTAVYADAMDELRASIARAKEKREQHGN